MSAKDIHAAIAEVYQAVGYVQKGRSKEGGVPYSFAGESALIEAIRPAMIEAGIYMHVLTIGEPFREVYLTGSGKSMNRTALHMTVRFTHAASGTFIDVQAMGEGSDSADKSHAKAATIGFKYALRQTFCIETGDDPDNARPEERASKRAPTPLRAMPDTPHKDVKPVSASYPPDEELTKARAGFFAECHKVWPKPLDAQEEAHKFFKVPVETGALGEYIKRTAAATKMTEAQTWRLAREQVTKAKAQGVLVAKDAP